MARRKQRKALDKGRCRTIYDMYKGGMRVVEISKVLRAPRSTISNVIRRYKKQNVSKRRGRKPSLCIRSLRRLQRSIHENPFKPLALITAEFNTYSAIQLSERTIRRYIHKLKLNSYVSVQKPFLLSRHRVARVEWARKHHGWDTARWSTVMFTDESSFAVMPTKNHCRVWRLKSTRYDMRYVTPTFKSGYQLVNVWGGFSNRGRTPLVRVNGRFNQHKYKSIIEETLLPFMMQNHGGTEEFVLQEDNCGPHRANSIAKYFRAKGVSRMKWPAQSPDLNPMENVWGHLKQILRKRAKRPTTCDQLFSILQSEWDALPNSYFTKLAHSMPTRVLAVKRAKGGSTKY